VCTNGDNVADAFVASDEGKLARQRPITQTGVEICVAHASAVHLKKTLSRGEVIWLLHRMVIFNANRCVVGVDYSGLLNSWDLLRHRTSSEREKSFTRGILYDTTLNLERPRDKGEPE
jgi:hypothetical protein